MMSDVMKYLTGKLKPTASVQLDLYIDITINLELNLGRLVKMKNYQ